jgi:hypothetical protein
MDQQRTSAWRESRCPMTCLSWAKPLAAHNVTIYQRVSDALRCRT